MSLFFLDPENVCFNAFLVLSLSGLLLRRNYISAKDATTHLFDQAIQKTTRKIPSPQINKDVKKQGIYLSPVRTDNKEVRWGDWMNIEYAPNTNVIMDGGIKLRAAECQKSLHFLL